MTWRCRSATTSSSASALLNCGQARRGCTGIRHGLRKSAPQGVLCRSVPLMPQMVERSVQRLSQLRVAWKPTCSGHPVSPHHKQSLASRAFRCWHPTSLRRSSVARIRHSSPPRSSCDLRWNCRSPGANSASCLDLNKRRSCSDDPLSLLYGIFPTETSYLRPRPLKC